MKKQFFDLMLEIMKDNEDVYLIFVGLGYPRLEEFLEKFPDRAFNFEASEQSALDCCCGLAYAGKIPVVYTIAPFLLRGFETIRTYIDHENLSVIMVGAGRNDEYSQHDGFSHYEGDMKEIFLNLKKLTLAYPKDNEELKQHMNLAFTKKGPWYINVKRS